MNLKTQEQNIIASLDPGIRALVIYLRERGVPTCDSGDGVTKVECIADGTALDVPHVHVLSWPDVMVADAKRLALFVADYVEETGDTRFAAAEVTATYSTGDDICTLSVLGDKEGRGR